MKFQTDIDESAEAEMRRLESGVHLRDVTGPLWPTPLATNYGACRSSMSLKTKTSFVSVPKATKSPVGLTYIVNTLYG